MLEALLDAGFEDLGYVDSLGDGEPRRTLRRDRIKAIRAGSVRDGILRTEWLLDRPDWSFRPTFDSVEELERLLRIG